MYAALVLSEAFRVDGVDYPTMSEAVKFAYLICAKNPGLEEIIIERVVTHEGVSNESQEKILNTYSLPGPASLAREHFMSGALPKMVFVDTDSELPQFTAGTTTPTPSAPHPTPAMIPDHHHRHRRKNRHDQSVDTIMTLRDTTALRTAARS